MFFFLDFLDFFGFVWWARTLLFQQKRIFTKPRENQKTKKPKLFGEVLVSGQKMFFLVFLEFFLFFFGLDS